MPSDTRSPFLTAPGAGPPQSVWKAFTLPSDMVNHEYVGIDKTFCILQNMKVKEHATLTMEQRTKRVKRICADLWRTVPLENLTDSDIPPRLLVSDRYKVYACKAAKVGSTNLQRIFYVLNGLTNDTDTGKIKTPAARKETSEFFAGHKKNNMEEFLPRLKTYTSFMFVRDPLERVLSAYRDNKPDFAIFQNKSRKPTFNEYVDILLEKDKHNEKPNRPLYKLCDPCRLRYDFIGSLDNFDNDMNTILKAVGAEKAVIIPKREGTGYSQKPSSTVVETFYKDVPAHKVKKLKKIYEMDYLIFGFEK